MQPLPGQQVQVTMRLSGPAPQPLSFTIDNPARISFDLPNTTLALPSRRIRPASDTSCPLSSSATTGALPTITRSGGTPLTERVLSITERRRPLFEFLALLDRLDVRATFFLLGRWAARVAPILKDGHG